MTVWERAGSTTIRDLMPGNLVPPITLTPAAPDAEFAQGGSMPEEGPLPLPAGPHPPEPRVEQLAQAAPRLVAAGLVVYLDDHVAAVNGEEIPLGPAAVAAIADIVTGAALEFQISKLSKLRERHGVQPLPVSAPTTQGHEDLPALPGSDLHSQQNSTPGE